MRKFESPDCTIYLGSAMDVLREAIPDGSINLIFADPPYNIGKSFKNFDDKWPSDEAYVDWCKQWIDLCFRKLTPDGTFYLMSSTQAMPYLDIYIRSKFHILSRIVWRYDSSGVQARKYYGSMYEPILHCVKDKKNYVFNSKDIEVEARTGAVRKLIDYRGDKPKPYNTKKVPGNVWSYPRVRYRMPEYEDHPSQKPEALLERIIIASSEPGDRILDPFGGTFTTCAVAQTKGRYSIGIEREMEYIKIGLRRLNIADSLDGEKLEPPRKNYRTKNGRRANTQESAKTETLFGDL